MSDHRIPLRTHTFLMLGVFVLLAALCAPAFASIVLTDDFESTAWSTNWAGTNWLTRVAAPASGHGSWSLSLTNVNQRITRGGWTIPAIGPYGLRFYFYDQSGAKGDFLAASTPANIQAFALGNTTGGDNIDFEMVAPMAWWGNNIWAPTDAARALGVWRRCEIYYSGSVAKFYVDGVLVKGPAFGPNNDQPVVVPTEDWGKLVAGIGGPAETVPASYIDDIALFSEPAFLETGVTADSVGKGTVTGAVSGLHDATEPIDITAVPATGYELEGWVDNGTFIGMPELNPLPTLYLAADYSLLAKFRLQAGYVALVLNVSPAGAGTTTGAQGYTSASTASAGATANPGYTFSKWSTAADGSDTVSTANPYSFTINSDTTLYAIFTPNPYTLSLIANAGGTIDPSSSSGTQLYHTACTVKAVPNTGKAFNGWSTDAAGNNIVSKLATYTFNMPAQNYTLYANFTTQQKFNFTDGFESRAIGVLDSNYSGPNAGANGDPNGNPWWGTMPSNARALASHTTYAGLVIYPHSGGKLVGYRPGNGLNYINAAYRANGGNALIGNCVADWWFYDPWGSVGKFDGTVTDGYASDAVSLCNFVGLPKPPHAYDDVIPAGKDYPPSASSENYGDDHFSQKLSLGCAKDITGYQTPDVPGNFDGRKYQARIMGSSGLPGQYSTRGWMNLPKARSAGWHHGRIYLGPQKPNTHNDVSFYIDDMVVPLLTADSGAAPNYNLLEVTMQMKGQVDGVTQTYPECVPLDDFAFASIPAVVNLVVNPSDHINTPTTQVTWDSIGATSFKLQVDSGSWVSASSPYTLDVSGLAYGTHTVGVKGIDVGSNEGMPATATFFVDRSAIKTWAVIGHYLCDNVIIPPATTPPTTGSVRYSTDLLAPQGSETNMGDGSHPIIGAAYNGKTWFSYTCPGQSIDFNVAYGNPTGTYSEWGVSYLFTYIKNSGAAITDAYLCGGTDDGMKVFVNGTMVLGHDVYRGLTIDGDMTDGGAVPYTGVAAPFTLNPGINRLLVKVTQGSTGYQGQARLCAAAKAYPTAWMPQVSYTLSPAVALSNIYDLWAESDGGVYTLSSKTVSMVGTGAFWIEETNRASAIKVLYSGTLPAKAHSVDVTGMLGMSGTQRVLTASAVTDKGAVTAIKTLGVVERSTGGAGSSGKPSITDGKGLYNVAIYVRLAGSVNGVNTTDPNNKVFYLDDGSGLSDGTGTGIKVLCGTTAPPAPPAPPATGRAIVIGAVGTVQAGSKVVPVIELESWRAP